MKLSRNSVILIVIELLFLLCLVPGLLRKKETVVDGNPISEWTETDRDAQVVLESGEIELSRGIYDVNIVFEPVSEEGVFLKLDTTGSPSCYGLMCDLRNTWLNPPANVGMIEKRIYVMDRTAGVNFTLAVPVDNDCGLDKIVITRTNAGARVLLVISLVVMGFANLCVWMRKRVLAGKTDFASQLAFWSVIASAIYTMLPELTDCIGVNLFSAEFGGKFFDLRMNVGKPDYLTAIPLLLYKIGFPGEYGYKIWLLLINFACAMASYFVFKLIFSDKYLGTFGMYAFMLSPLRLNAMFRPSEVSLKVLATGYIGAFLVAGVATFVMKLLLTKYKNRKHLCYTVCGLAVVCVFLIGARVLDMVALSADPMWIY